MSRKNAENTSVPDGGSVPVAETPETAPTIDLAKEIEDVRNAAAANEAGLKSELEEARKAAAALSTQNDDLRAGIEDGQREIQRLHSELNRLGAKECVKCRYPLISCICPKEIS